MQWEEGEKVPAASSPSPTLRLDAGFEAVTVMSYIARKTCRQEKLASRSKKIWILLIGATSFGARRRHQ